MWAPVATISDCRGRRSHRKRPSPQRTSGCACGAAGGQRLYKRRTPEAPAGGGQRGTWSRGSMATQARCAAAVSGGVDQGGRWVCASTPARRAEAEGATTRQLAARPGAAAMVVKKQGSYLAAAVVQTKLKRSCSCCVVQRQGQKRSGSYQGRSIYFLLHSDVQACI